MTTLSLRGVYNYASDVLDNFAVPDGVDTKILFPLLLADTSDLELLYPSAPVLKQMIGVWSQSMTYKWERLYNTTVLDYNPIENYDRQEEWTTKINNKTTGNAEQHSTGKTTPSGKDVQTHEVAGYDSGVLAQSERMTNAAGIVTDTAADSRVSNNDILDGTEDHTGRTHGNIGVTTTQQMLRTEREIADFSIYNAIIRDFITRFCLEVY